MKHLDYLKRNDWTALVEATHYVKELKDSGAEWFEAFEEYCLRTKSPRTWLAVYDMRPHVDKILNDLCNEYYETCADAWEPPSYDDF